MKRIVFAILATLGTIILVPVGVIGLALFAEFIGLVPLIKSIPGWVLIALTLVVMFFNVFIEYLDFFERKE